MKLYLWAAAAVLLVTLGASAAGADTGNGTIWAVLVTGSYGYENYRHQVKYLLTNKRYSVLGFMCCSHV